MKALRNKGLIVALLISTGANAANKVTESPKWQQEPVSFLGISLTGNLKSDQQQCPSGYELPTEICYKVVSGDLYQMWGLPKIGIDNPKLYIKLKDSSIQYLKLDTYADQFLKLRDLLVQKYGKPSFNKSEPVKTMVGATFNNETLYWQGTSVTMVLSKYSDDIETSSLTIMNERAAIKALTDRDKQIKDAASKL